MERPASKAENATDILTFSSIATETLSWVNGK